MSTFDNENLFASGPHEFTIGGIELREVIHESPGSRGVKVSAQGIRGRRMKQTGQLIADTLDELYVQMDLIQAKIDGLAHELVDHTGRAWANVVMERFDRKAPHRLGTRWAVAYDIDYLQVTP